MAISIIKPNSLGGVPCFSAYNNATTSVTNAISTKVALQVEEFDTANAFDSTTNYRFQPLVAGYYQVSGSIYTAATSGIAEAFIYKTGAAYKGGGIVPAFSGGAVTGVSCLVYLNGTTDYIELYAYQNSGTTSTVLANQVYTYFQATFVRGA